MDESKRMWIQAPGQPEPDTLGEFIPITKWVELYGTHKWQAHVVCPEEHTVAVSKGAVEVLDDLYGLKFNEWAKRYAHISE